MPSPVYRGALVELGRPQLGFQAADAKRRTSRPKPSACTPNCSTSCCTTKSRTASTETVEDQSVVNDQYVRRAGYFLRPWQLTRPTLREAVHRVTPRYRCTERRTPVSWLLRCRSRWHRRSKPPTVLARNPAGGPAAWRAHHGACTTPCGFTSTPRRPVRSNQVASECTIIPAPGLYNTEPKCLEASAYR